MAETTITLAGLFALQPGQPSMPIEPPWHEKLGARLDEELKGVKWPTALPDLAKKLGELLDLPVPPLFLRAWKDMDALKEAIMATKENPQETRAVVLHQHPLDVSLEPSIEIRLWKVMPLPKKLVFPVKLTATFRTLELQVKKGAVVRIVSGECDISGTVSLGDTVIAKKEFGALSLAGALFDEEVESEATT